MITTSSNRGVINKLINKTEQIETSLSGDPEKDGGTGADVRSILFLQNSSCFGYIFKLMNQSFHSFVN